MSLIRKLISLIIFVSCTASAEIISIAAMSDLSSILIKEQASSNSLVAFDIDMTLTVPKHQALYHQNIQKYKVELKKITGNLTKLEKDMVLCQEMQRLEQIILENQSLLITEELKSKNIKTIALTGTLNGLINNVDMAKWRYETLDKMGFNFKSSFDAQLKVLDDVPKYNNMNPEYYKGILIANGEFKGRALVSFLKYVNFNPDKVFMIDDKKSNLVYIQECLNKFNSNIKYIGIEYTASKTYGENCITKEDFINFWQEAVSNI